MSKLITRIKRLALALCFVTPLVSWADAIPVVNPVTGETETYENVFTSETTEWNSAENWTLKETDKVPFVSGGNFDPALVDGKTVSTSTAIDGWTLRVGAYNGAAVTWDGGITKIQAGTAGCWLTADETSSITASFNGNNKQLEGSDTYPFKLSSASVGGITWTSGLASAGNTSLPFWYYLKGAGTVVYGGDITVANAQVIKMADVTLSGNEKSVQSKTLVTFGSGTTATFTADAAIKVKNGDGVVLRTVPLASVTAADDTTLTTDDYVGTCELVQKTDGVYLYWVDGDSENLPVYKPSININFTSGAAYGLTTRTAVGLDGYAVPGTSWNNFTIPDNANVQTFNSVNSIDSTGAASVASGVSVTVSGHRGSYSCGSLDAASNPLHGYIDEGAQKATPTVTITGIPYEHYRVIVYHSTDSADKQFGYDTINGFNFTYVNGVQTTGTDSWGASGADKSAEPIAEGVNTLVSAVLSGDTVTMVAHRIADPFARGCFAAIQVVEYVPEVGENDLEIAVDGATEYEVTEAKELSGTVYLTGSGTLTLTGSEKITAATIDVAKDVVLNIDADRLDATTFTGAGTVVYDTTAPVEGKGWANIGWSGTVWIKNQSVSSFEGTKFGNAGSTVRFTGVTGFLQTSSWSGSTYVHTVPLELVDEGETVAFTYNNGWGGNLVKINTLKGTGTLKTQGSGAGEHIYIVDASGFTGVFNLTAKSVYVGGDAPAYSDATGQSGKLEIRSGVTMTVPSSKTWTANGGFVVNGTLNVDGTLASSHTTKAVSGSGTVVFTGRAPTVSGDAWWKNADWTGTVQVKDVTNMVGDSRAGVWLKFNDYGNSGSVVEMNNVTGWLETGYTCTPKIKITGTLYLNNGSSGKAYAFKVGTLLGSGAISGDGSADKVIFNVTDDWSGFTGTIGLNNKCIVFGETIPDTLTAGTIYISEGAVVTPQQSSGTWWAVGGIKVDGELRAPNLDKFGGGTTITTSDNGVFTLIDSNNTYDTATNYARITGTGTLRYAEVSGKWRTLSKNNFPTGMICENNLSTGLILETPSETYTIGSLAGSGAMRSDMSNGNRDLRILQAKDTTYSGVFHSSDRIGTVTVAPGATTVGTLTLSGTQTVSNDLAIESGAKVNLTGTWKGATTVAGTIGGTGTLTGDLTFSEGATFKAFAADDADGLVVSGTVACPAEGKVTVDVSAIEPETDVALLKATGLNADNFALTGATEGATLDVVEGVLTLKVPVPTTVTITVPVVENATATVTVGGEPVEISEGKVTVDIGAEVVVTYTAVSGYRLPDGVQSVYNVTADEAKTVPVSEELVPELLVAKVRNTTTSQYDEYTSLAAAVAAAADGNHNPMVTLMANVDEAEVTIGSIVMLIGNYTISSDVTIADGGQLQIQQVTLAGTLTIEDGGVYATGTGTLGTLVAEDGAIIQLSTLSTDSAPLSITTLTVEGNLTVVSSYAGAVRGTTYKAISYVTANATIAQGATVAGVNEWSADTTVDGDNTVVTLEITAVAKVDGVYYDDAQDAVDAAVASGKPVEFIISDPGTVTLGAGETLSVKGVNLPTVELEDGLTTPPYSLENSGYDSVTGLTTFTVVKEVSVVPAEIELYYNCTSQVSVVGYDAGSTFYWLEETIDGEPTVGSTYSFSGTIKPLSISGGRKTDTVKFYSNNTNGTWHLTALVTNNNEQVANPVVSVTVKDVAAVVGGVEYSRAQFADAIAAAIANDEVLGLYLSAPDATLAVGETLRVKVLATRSVVNLPTVTGPEGTAGTVYVVNKVKDTSTGITTFSLTEEEPSVMFTDGVTTEYYPANFKATKAGTYKLLKDITRSQLSVGTTGVVLDLNGKTFTSTATGTTAAILVSSTLGSASLTITGEGSIVAPNYSVVQAGKNGSVTIESGSFSGKTVIVYTASGGTAAISGGTFAMVSGSASSMLNCKDDNRGTIAVTGGTFTGFDPANTSDGNMVSDGYQSTETSTGSGVWVVTKKQGINPEDPESKQEVVIDPTDKDEDQIKEAAVQEATVTIPEAVPAEAKAAITDYKSYFELKATVTNPETGACAVEIVGFKDDVVQDVNEDAVEALKDAVADTEATTVAVEVPAGLYYVVETYEALGTPVDSEEGWSTGTTTPVGKPTGTTQGFIRVRISTAEITD